MKINSLTCAAIKYAQYFINSEAIAMIAKRKADLAAFFPLN